MLPIGKFFASVGKEILIAIGIKAAEIGAEEAEKIMRKRKKKKRWWRR